MHALKIATVLLTATVIVLTAAGATAELAGDTIASDDGELTICPVDHATFVMAGAGKVIYVDPVGGVEAFGDFEPPDLILITHIHGDHTSAETMQTISTDETTVVAPSTVAEKLGEGVPGQLHVLANGESLDWGGIKIEAVPAYNLTEERKSFHPKGRDNGYVVTVGGKRIYIAGDTEDIPEMRALTNIDAAFVCMNLPYTMTVENAADAVLEFAPKIVYPYHHRGKDGMSDLGAFEKLVAGNPEIDVRLLDWYPTSGPPSESTLYPTDYVYLDTEGNPLPFQDKATILEALRTGAIIEREQMSRGVAKNIKLVLEFKDSRCKKAVRFNAVMRLIDVSEKEKTGSQRMVVKYRDSHIFESAAYELSEVLGIGRVPPTAVRVVTQAGGTVQIWMEGTAPEDIMLEKGLLKPPDKSSWWKQKAIMWVFDALIANTDRNQGNLLIDEDWNLWLIDHTRAFRETSVLFDVEHLDMCEKKLWTALLETDDETIRKRLDPYLTSAELTKLFLRKQKLIKHFNKRIKKHGEKKILYDLQP